MTELDDTKCQAIESDPLGLDRWSNDDSKEKRDIGAMWASISGGRCKFVMVTTAEKVGGVSVVDQIRRAIA